MSRSSPAPAREDQVDQGRALAAQGRALEGLAQAVGALVAGQAQHSERLDALAAGQARHGQILDTHTRTLETLVTGQAAILEELRRSHGSS